jgi:GT2 family glycosyltransferase
VKGFRRRRDADPTSPQAEVNWPVRNLLASGLLDRGWYETLRGRTFADDSAAVEDFVEWAMPRELAPHPLLDVASAPKKVRNAWRTGHPKPWLSDLETTKRPALGMLLDTPTVRGHASVAAFLSTLTATDAVPLPPRAARGSLTVGEARAGSLAVHAALASTPPLDADDWTAADLALPSRVAGRTSIVMPTYEDASMTERAVRRVVEHRGGLDVEVIVVDNGSADGIHLALHTALDDTPGVRLLRSPTNLNFAGGSNAGLLASTGDVVVFLNNDTEVGPGWLPPLRAALEDPTVAGVQPLLVYGDHTIQTAGTVFLADGLLPCHLLSRHPVEDAAGVAAFPFEVITAAAMAVRATDALQARGFDTGYANGFEDVDLCLRLGRETGRSFRVLPDVVVTHHESQSPGRYDHVSPNRKLFTERWRGYLPAPTPEVYDRLGFQLVSVEDDGQEYAAARPTIDRGDRDPEHRRWSLKISSTPGQWGDAWGDTHFAADLARALRDLGQTVGTSRHGAHAAGPTHLDDVSLFIRGLHSATPVPGTLNILWVISHPDTVTPDEVQQFDLVFAASRQWAANMSARSGVDVRPLLQATAIDPDAITEPWPDEVTEAVFVGSSAGRSRPLVHDVIAAGIPVAVYGHGWDGLLPEGSWKGRWVDPADLPALYRRHGLVIADHWPDMAANGFLSNRVYDAVAAGAHVITDHLPDGSDLPPGSVTCWSGVAGEIPAEERRSQAADEVRNRHGFGDRAQAIGAYVD